MGSTGGSAETAAFTFSACPILTGLVASEKEPSEDNWLKPGK